MVDSPKDPPNSEFGLNVTSGDGQQSAASSIDVNIRDDVTQSNNTDQTATFTFDVDEPVDVNKPIDVNEQPRDTSNIIYDYAEPADGVQIIDAQANTENPSTSGIATGGNMQQTHTINTENENSSGSNSSPSSPSS